MRSFFQLLFALIALYLFILWFLFGRHAEPQPRYNILFTPASFLENRANVAGEYIRMHGTVDATRYFAGIGLYALEDKQGYRLLILCNSYPPPEGREIEILIYVQPLVKPGDTPVTLQVEVGAAASNDITNL